MKKNEKKNTETKVIKEGTKKSYKLFLTAGMLLIVLFFIGYYVTENNSATHVKISTKNIEDVECLKKGNTCTREDIIAGIKVKYKVNNNTTKEFYVISDDKDTITLILDQNLTNSVNWHSEMINFKGPMNGLTELNKLVDKWDNVPYIDNYSYDDYGYQYYLKVCDTKEIELDKEFDCTKNPGYKNIKINKGEAEILYNMPPIEEKDLPEGLTMEKIQLEQKGKISKVKARFITFEEISNLVGDQAPAVWLIDNLSKGKEYWTMSSVPYAGNYYISDAFTVKNVKGKTDLGTSRVRAMEASQEQIKKDKEADTTIEIGARPVITIPKKG